MSLAGSGHGRPLVFAHRGSSAAVAEHTEAAYARAIAEGVDGLECDVRLTRDGHLVCVHDRRLERTSDGRGAVSRYTLAELSAFDFGSWHRSDEPVGPAAILSFERLLLMAMAAGRPLTLLVETKHPTRHGASVEQALAAILRRHGLAEPNPGATVQVTMMSFSLLAVRRMGQLTPRLPRVLLGSVWLPSRASLPFGAEIGGPGMRLVRMRPGLVSRMHQSGHQVYVWTVNEPTDVDLTIELGVDGIITDRPAYVMERLHSLGAVYR